MTRIVIADRQEIARAGLKTMINGDASVVGEADSLVKMREQLLVQKPHILISAATLYDPVSDNLKGNFIDVIPSLQRDFPSVKIAIFLSRDSAKLIARMVAMNVNGVLNRDCTSTELREDLVRLMKGEQVLRLAKDSTGSDEPLPLTNRETQVLRHVALGLSNREIGFSLNISIETVKEHVQNILRKLDANDRTQAAVWAVRKGLV